MRPHFPCSLCLQERSDTTKQKLQARLPPIEEKLEGILGFSFQFFFHFAFSIPSALESIHFSDKKKFERKEKVFSLFIPH